MRVKVNRYWDLSMGILSHHGPWQPAVVGSIEMVVPQNWFPGYFIGQNQFAETVRHKDEGICQDGHDIGMLIPDLTPAPIINPWYPLMWLFSSRSMVFSARRVKMEKKATGLAQCGIPFNFTKDGFPWIPMMTCGEFFSLPTTCMLTNHGNTVIVGMTVDDLISGIIAVAVSIAIDFLLYYLSKAGDAADAAKANTKGMTKSGKTKYPKIATEAAEQSTPVYKKYLAAVGEGAFSPYGKRIYTKAGFKALAQWVGFRALGSLSGFLLEWQKEGERPDSVTVDLPLGFDLKFPVDDTGDDTNLYVWDHPIFNPDAA